MKSMHYLLYMDIKKNFIPIILFIVSFSFLFATCKKHKGECIGNAYSLKEKWNILPEKDSINVGDTLIFTSTFSNRPYDFNSSTNVDFSGSALVGTSFFIRSINGFNNLKDAVDSFDFFTISGKLEQNSSAPKRTKDIFWLEENNMYKIKFGMIAKKRGDYSFVSPNATGKLNKQNTCESGAGIILNNSNIKNNAYLFYPYYGGPFIPLDDSAHLFCIRVK